MTVQALALVLVELANTPRAEVRRNAARIAPVIVRQAAAVTPPLDPVLVGAVAWRESGYRMDARGSAGEVGALQIHPLGMGRYLCRDLDVSRLRDNVRCGLRILSHARSRCGGDPVRWLSAYSGRRCGPSPYSRGVVRDADRARTAR